MFAVTRRGALASVAAAAAKPFLGVLEAIEPSKLKLSITSDEIEEDLAGALPFFAHYGIGYTEIRNLSGKYNTSQPESLVREARKQLDAAGVRTCVLDTGFFKIPLPADDPEGRRKIEEQWELLERAFVRAEILGTNVVRTFAFTYPRGEAADRNNYPRIVELVKESVRRAKARGMKLALENVGQSYIATAKQSARMLREVSDETLGLTWDPNNSAQMGDPEPFPAGYRMLDPARIFHLHLRDFRRTPDGGAEWCGVGQGEFDHVGQIRALLADGYKGAFSLETHFKIDGSKRKGSEFSMQALLERVRKV